ncbi:MAG: hypothetical protein OSB41_12425, partial [Kiritimatiellae bacterium]|nr:hypothetical protein [Kiritimatiellia bacterium]
LVAMRFACMIYGISNIGWTRISLVLLIGILSLIGAAAATSLYLLRYIKDPVVKQVVMFGLPILAFVVFGIPAQCKILKSSFLKMFLAFTSSVLVAIFAINVAHTCYKSLGEGQKRSESIRARSTNFESLVDE